MGEPSRQSDGALATSDAPMKSPADVRELAPHEGRLLLNNPAGDDKTWVVDSALMQRRPLPPGVWQLEFVDGFCAAQDISNDDGAIILMEEFLDKQLWVDADGERWVTAQSALEKPPWSLTARLSRFQETSPGCGLGLPIAFQVDCAPNCEVEGAWPKLLRAGCACELRWVFELVWPIEAISLSPYGSITLRVQARRTSRWLTSCS